MTAAEKNYTSMFFSHIEKKEKLGDECFVQFLIVFPLKIGELDTIIFIVVEMNHFSEVY